MEDEISIQSSVHRVQLTLDDLSYSEGDHMSATTESISHHFGDQSHNPQDYKRELTKLLKKSKGTPYEKTLRKFVESKLREINHDLNQKTRSTTPTSSYPNNPASPETNKIALLSLSKSKYDSPSRGHPLSHQAIPDEELSRLRLEELSQPLDRNRYQGVYDPRVTTNHIGRQRPPPKLDEQRYSLSPGKPAIVTTSSIRHQSNPNSPLRRSQELLDTPNTKVPMQEFRQWLRRNRRWDQTNKDKMENSRDRISAEMTEKSKPRIVKKSIKLAELAQNRESLEYLRLQDLLRQEQQKHQHDPHSKNISGDHSVASTPGGSRYGHHHATATATERPLTSIALGGIQAYFPANDPNIDVDALLRGSLGNDVFERLSARGKIHTERKKIMQEREQAMHLARHSFAPQLAPHTEQLAAKYYKRKEESDRSRSRSRESVQRLSASRATSRERSQTPTTLSRKVSNPATDSSTSLKPMLRSSSPPLPTTQQASDPQPSSSSSSANNRAHSQPPPSRRSKTRQELVQEDIAKVRAKSRERRDAQVRQEMKRQFLPASNASSSLTVASSAQTSHAAMSSAEEPLTAVPTTSRPFTPTLVARNTTQQLVRSSFEERNIVAVERKAMRQVLSSREPSPGPGQYRGTEAKIEQQLLSSPVRHRNRATSVTSASSNESSVVGTLPERFQSPGARGYSFGKGKLRSSIIPNTCSHEDVNKLTYQAMKQQPLLSSSVSSSILLRSPRASFITAAITGKPISQLMSVPTSEKDDRDAQSTASHSANSYTMNNNANAYLQQNNNNKNGVRNTPGSSLLSVSSSNPNNSNHNGNSNNTAYNSPPPPPNHTNNHHHATGEPSSSSIAGISARRSLQASPPQRPLPPYSNNHGMNNNHNNSSNNMMSSPPPPPPPPLTSAMSKPPAASLTSMLSPSAYHI